MRWPPRLAAAMQWVREHRRQALFATDSRANERTKAPWRSTHDNDWIPDIGHWVIFTVLVSFTLI